MGALQDTLRGHSSRQHSCDFVKPAPPEPELLAIPAQWAWGLLPPTPGTAACCGAWNGNGPAGNPCLSLLPPRGTGLFSPPAGLCTTRSRTTLHGPTSLPCDGYTTLSTGKLKSSIIHILLFQTFYTSFGKLFPD